MLLAELVATSATVAAASARGAKTRLVADALRAARPAEVELAVAFLSGRPRQRRPGVGWAALRERPPAAKEPSLTLADVDNALERLAVAAGAGSSGQRRTTLDALLARATTGEQDFLVRLLLGELRQGALESVVLDALAMAAELPAAQVRRAVMLRGDAAAVARLALAEGSAGLATIGLAAGRAVQPMLAQSARTVAAALERTGEAAVEWKLDGVRVQVHLDRASAGGVRVFTRSLDDVTGRLPETVAAALALPASVAVLDGEVIALGADGRPRPFQETASGFASRTTSDIALTTWFFDVLHLDGRDLLDEPGTARWAALDLLVPARQRVPRVVTADAATAELALAEALAAGHEGVVVKAVDAPWEAGRRGAGWVKVKPVHTLDLLVIAAEWGHGRRAGWLSNLHLAARGEDRPVMLGKTFKGLTDELLGWQTGQLLARETGRSGHVVHVRPELVVEIALDGLQRSTRYPGGVALRFARVLRYRSDKPPAEADDLTQVLALLPPS